MTIYKLERETTANTILMQLPRLWNSINHLVTQLRDTTRVYMTTEILNLRNGFVNNYTLMNNFNTTHGTWFATKYPEFAIALTGAITSLQNINTVLMSGLTTYYWDAETNKPIVSEILQTHRNALANSIASELEAR